MKLTDLLQRLPALDEDKIKPFVLTELEPICTHDEFSFLYTQLVLKKLSLSPENGKLSGYRLRRIAYELDQYLSDVEGGKVMSEALICSEGISTELSVAIINIIGAKNAKPSAADLIRVGPLCVGAIALCIEHQDSQYAKALSCILSAITPIGYSHEAPGLS